MLKKALSSSTLIKDRVASHNFDLMKQSVDGAIDSINKNRIITSDSSRNFSAITITGVAATDKYQDVTNCSVQLPVTGKKPVQIYCRQAFNNGAFQGGGFQITSPIGANPGFNSYSALIGLFLIKNGSEIIFGTSIGGGLIFAAQGGYANYFYPLSSVFHVDTPENPGTASYKLSVNLLGSTGTLSVVNCELVACELL